MFKIGIDLSTKNIGYCVLVNNNQIIVNNTFNLPSYNPELITIINFKIKELVELIANELVWYTSKNNLLNTNQKINTEIGIELSNHTNPKFSQLFGKYAGIIETYFLNIFKQKEINITKYKYFNANGWFGNLAKKNNISHWNILKRNDRKKISINNHPWNNNIELQKKLNDDIADSYHIAYFLNEIEDSIIKKQNQKNIDKEINKYKNEIKKLKQKSKLVKSKFKNKNTIIKKQSEINQKIELLKNKIDNLKPKYNRVENKKETIKTKNQDYDKKV